MTPICRRTETGYHLREHHPDCRDGACPGCVECRHDDHGNPVRHCPIRHACSNHLPIGEEACAGCLNRIRRNLGAILTAKAAMPAEATYDGVDSEAADLAGPSAHLILSSWRKVNAAAAGEDVEDHDQGDAYTMLAMRERMIREDLGHDQHTLVSDTLTGVVGYLDWVLTDLARGEAQVLVLADLLGETSRLRSHLEAVLHDSRTPEQGRPCPECSDEGRSAPRLRKRYADYDRTGASDTWRCPWDAAHTWSEADYRLRVAGDYLQHADVLPADQLAERLGVPISQVRKWAAREWDEGAGTWRDAALQSRKKGHDGRKLYPVEDALRLAEKVGA